jgi:hypothetical protein
MELTINEAIKTKALVAREKLFISETSNENNQNLRPGDFMSFTLFRRAVYDARAQRTGCAARQQSSLSV